MSAKEMEDIWDDSALIDAYDKAINLAYVINFINYYTQSIPLFI